MLENATVKRLNEITVQSLRAGERRNARQQVAFTFRIPQWERRISFEPGNFRYNTLTFRQRLDQTAIKLVDTVAKGLKRIRHGWRTETRCEKPRRNLSRPSELRQIWRAERKQKKQVARNKPKCGTERRDLKAHQAQAIVEPVPKSSHLNVVPGENTSVGAETDRRSPTGSKRGSAAT